MAAKTQHYEHLKEIARVCGDEKTKLEAKVTELEAKVTELEAKVTELEADKARLAQADLLKPDHHPINDPDRQG
jgi:predicted nuclease with TOPRIM domain